MIAPLPTLLLKILPIDRCHRMPERHRAEDYADCVLALKGNQGSLREDVELFAAEPAVTSHVMVRFQNLASALANDNAGRHGITGNDARHDRSVRDPQLIDAVNPETVVHD
jgi:hypothetical protein